MRFPAKGSTIIGYRTTISECIYVWDSKICWSILKLSTKGYFISLLNEPVDVLISETPTSDLEQVVEIACNLGWILLASE